MALVLSVFSLNLMPGNQPSLWQLISKKLSGEANKVELEKLAQLTSSNYEAGLYHELISDYWKNTGFSNLQEAEDAYFRLLERIHESKKL